MCKHTCISLEQMQHQQCHWTISANIKKMIKGGGLQ